MELPDFPCLEWEGKLFVDSLCLFNLVGLSLEGFFQKPSFECCCEEGWDFIFDLGFVPPEDSETLFNPEEHEVDSAIFLKG